MRDFTITNIFGYISSDGIKHIIGYYEIAGGDHPLTESIFQKCHKLFYKYKENFFVETQFHDPNNEDNFLQGKDAITTVEFDYKNFN